MPLELATYLAGLEPANPVASDPIKQGDDHIRLLKTTLKNTFPNLNGAVTASPTELNILDGATVSTDEVNHLDGVTGPLQEQLNLKAPLADPTFTGTLLSPRVRLTSTTALTLASIDHGFQIGTAIGLNLSADNVSIQARNGVAASDLSLNALGGNLILGLGGSSVTNIRGEFQVNGVAVAATPAEINKLAGLATTAVELGRVAGVTSPIQTQLNGKAGLSGENTFTGTQTMARVRLTSTADVTLADNGNHAVQIGPDTGSNLRIDINEVQSVNNEVGDTLYLNWIGGDISMGSSDSIVRSRGPVRAEGTGANDLAVSATPGFMVGSPNSVNVAIARGGAIQGRDGLGGSSSISLNPLGGTINVGGTGQTQTINLHGNISGDGVASLAEAEAGSVNNRIMTPLRVKQAIDAHVFTGSGSGATDFPIGHQIIAYAPGVARNGTTTLRLDTVYNSRYVNNGSGSVLSGTWRARGNIEGTSDYLFERVA